MPARTASNANGATAVPQKKRFEIPALSFNFGSLTDGTDIPPPLPSPVQEVPTPPRTPTKTEALKKEQANGTGKGHGSQTEISPQSDATASPQGGVKRSAEDGPSSPTLSNRGSLRRLISKNLLNNSYNEDGATQTVNGGASRPSSRLSGVIGDDKKSKRSSGWFRRLRSNDTSTIASKRMSSFEEVKDEDTVPAGPPPPMIPELSALKTKVDTSLGDDLFKEIK